MESFEYLFDLLDRQNTVQSPQLNTDCCNNKNESIIDGFYTCTNCGTINPCSLLVVDKYDDHMHTVIYIPYKRVIYFKQKLQLLTGTCIYTPNAKLLYLINGIKSSKKKLSLSKIRLLLKKNNLNKYYKYIYSIYNDIYGEPLIKISCHIVSQMLYQFLTIERFFKKNIDRKNMLSYNIILFHLLKQHNIKNYDKMLLPYNATKIKKIFKRYNVFD
jgi:hypothetical protein